MASYYVYALEGPDNVQLLMEGFGKKVYEDFLDHS